MTIRSSLIFAACLLLPMLASAANVPLPDGMCALDQKVPEEGAVIDYMRTANIGYNQVLAIFAPCDELDQLSKKKINSLTHYGSVLGQELHAEIPMDRATYLASVAHVYQQTGGLLTSAAMDQSSGAIKNGTKEANLQNPQGSTNVSKGIIYQDPRMVMIGMQQTNNYGGAPVKVASVTSMTLIGSSPVSANYSDPLVVVADFSKS
jgi:hypothetical protein